MGLIQWNDSFSVGVTEIDVQHRTLVSMVNSYYDAVMNKESQEGLAKLISGLESYTIKHFDLEEKYFDKFGYEGSAEHKKAHADLKTKVKELKQKVSEKKTVLSLEVGKFLTDWLTHHIKGADKKYTRCFQEHGLK
jgi:hemerythrin-like metal-binding protein